MTDLPELAVEACGMTTALGLDVARACTAARAGIVRARALEMFRFGSTQTGEPEAAVGHSAGVVTDGFEGFGRLARLLDSAMASLWSNIEPPGETTIPVYLSVPDPARTASAFWLLAEPDQSIWQARIEALSKASPDERLERAREVATRLLATSHVQGPVPQLHFVSIGGSAGFGSALAATFRDIEARKTTRAIVGGIDSLLDEDTLSWLRATNRLKASDCPTGMMPGEAAALLLVHRPDEAMRSDNSGMVLVSRPKMQCEEGSWSGGHRSSGRALAALMTPPGAGPWVLADMNGEVHRSEDWGMALARLRPSCPDIDRMSTWCPAGSFGDTGAAYGAVASCWAVDALARGYAPAAAASVVASSDDGVRAGWAVRRATEHATRR